MSDPGKCATVISPNIGDDLDFLSGKGRKIAVGNQIITVLVVLSNIDEVSDIMEKRRIVQPFPLLSPKAM